MNCRRCTYLGAYDKLEQTDKKDFTPAVASCQDCGGVHHRAPDGWLYHIYRYPRMAGDQVYRNECPANKQTKADHTQCIYENA